MKAKNHQVLEYLGRFIETWLTGAQIGRGVGIPPSTIYRIMPVLHGHHLIMQDARCRWRITDEGRDALADRAGGC